jgi:hypothetical protein
MNIATVLLVSVLISVEPTEGVDGPEVIVLL